MVLGTAVPIGARHGEGFLRARESVVAEGTLGTALDPECHGGTHYLVKWVSPFIPSMYN